jgi:hypothetical protein
MNKMRVLTLLVNCRLDALKEEMKTAATTLSAVNFVKENQYEGRDNLEYYVWKKG